MDLAIYPSDMNPWCRDMYKTVYNERSCAPFFVRKAEVGQRGGKVLDKRNMVWYNNGAVEETATRKASESRVEKTWKKFGKPLDKANLMWYNIKVADKSGWDTETKLRKAVEKSSKNFEKPLDKGKWMWYNKEVAERTAASKEKNRSLKIEQQCTKRLRKFFWILKRSS